MTDIKPQPIDYSDGPIHTHFGLSYASYEVVPRVLAQSMPHEWQARFVACMDELIEAFAHINGADCYDVKPARDVYANELDEEQMALTGVFCIEDSPEGSDGYYDRDGNHIEGYAHIMVPVPDPLPPYNRGRTRVPRADQNAEPVGGWILWDSEGRWMHTTTWNMDANRNDDGWRAVSINEAEGREFRSKGCVLDRLDPAGWRAFDELRGTIDATGGRELWLAKKVGT